MLGGNQICPLAAIRKAPEVITDGSQAPGPAAPGLPSNAESGAGHMPFRIGQADHITVSSGLAPPDSTGPAELIQGRHCSRKEILRRCEAGACPVRAVPGLRRL